MSVDHNGGNILNAINLEEHNGLLNAKRTNLVSAATIFAVVNTAAAGQASIVIDHSDNYIGLVTATISNFANSTIYAVVNTGAAGQASVVLSPGVSNIGCVTLLNQPALTAGVAGIGFATVNVASIAAGVNYIGSATVQVVNVARTITGNVSISNIAAGANFIGIVTIANSNVRSIAGNVTLSGSLPAGVNAIGFATVYNALGTQFIGLVTAWDINAGTSKTLINLPIAFNASVATIAVPGTNTSVKITNMILSSDATTTVRLRSGVTYLTGNASLGLTLFPGGGFTMPGSPDSPSWIGLPSGALIIEKNNITTNVGGHVVYFAE
jgi:hypothetical protein